MEFNGVHSVEVLIRPRRPKEDICLTSIFPSGLCEVKIFTVTTDTYILYLPCSVTRAQHPKQSYNSSSSTYTHQASLTSRPYRLIHPLSLGVPYFQITIRPAHRYYIAIFSTNPGKSIQLERASSNTVYVAVVGHWKNRVTADMTPQTLK